MIIMPVPSPSDRCSRCIFQMLLRKEKKSPKVLASPMVNHLKSTSCRSPSFLPKFVTSNSILQAAQVGMSYQIPSPRPVDSHPPLGPETNLPPFRTPTV